MRTDSPPVMPWDTPEPVARLTPEDVARLRDDRRARSSLEIGAIIHVVQPLSADLLATLCFYLTYAATGSVGVATVLAAALGVGQLAWAIAHRQPVPPIQWASLLLVFAALGARGTLDLGRGRVQVVIGPEADQLAAGMRPLIDTDGPASDSENSRSEPRPQPSAVDGRFATLIDILQAMPGCSIEARGHRIIVDPGTSAVPAALSFAPGIRAVVCTEGATHILVDAPAFSIVQLVSKRTHAAT